MDTSPLICSSNPCSSGRDAGDGDASFDPVRNIVRGFKHARGINGFVKIAGCLMYDHRPEEEKK